MANTNPRIRTAYIRLRLPPAGKDAYARRATAEGLTLTQWVEQALQAQLATAPLGAHLEAALEAVTTEAQRAPAGSHRKDQLELAYYLLGRAQQIWVAQQADAT
jgi:hypothetical protein